MKTNSKEFQKLKETWYKKLKDETDFEDIEKSEMYLWHASEPITDTARIERAKANMEYYSMARRFLHDHKFENKKSKLIWENHSNGISMRDILKLLKKNKYQANTLWLVEITIKKLRKIMITVYSKEAELDEQNF